MGDKENQGGGAPGASGGAGAGTTGDSTGKLDDKSGGGAGDTKTVSWENHRRALDDMHKFKTKVSELETKLGDIESRSLQEKNDFKGLYEREKAQREEVAAKLKETNGYFVNTLRSNAVKTAAVEAGLIPKSVSDLELLDLSDVQVEVTSTGRFLVQGEKDFVERLKSNRPHWFQKPTPPNVNGGGGGGTPPPAGTLSAKDVYEAERLWKTGKKTKSEYEDVYKRYVAQGR